MNKRRRFCGDDGSGEANRHVPFLKFCFVLAPAEGQGTRRASWVGNSLNSEVKQLRLSGEKISVIQIDIVFQVSLRWPRTSCTLFDLILESCGA